MTVKEAKLDLQAILKTVPEARARIAKLPKWQQQALKGISCCWWNENCPHKIKKEK